MKSKDDIHAKLVSDVDKETECRNIKTSNSNAEIAVLGSQTVMGSVKEMVQNVDNGKCDDESPVVSKEPDMARDSASLDDEHIKNSTKGNDDRHIIEKRTEKDCTNVESESKNDLTDSNTDNTATYLKKLEQENAAEMDVEESYHKDKTCTEITETQSKTSTEITETQGKEERAYSEINSDKSSAVDESKGTAILGNASGEIGNENVEESFIITDVRSLTEDSATDAGSNTTEVAVSGNQAILALGSELLRQSDTVLADGNSKNNANSEVSLTSQYRTESGKNGTSSGAVQSVSDQTDEQLAKNVHDKDTGEQLTINTGLSSSRQDGVSSAQQNGTPDLEKGDGQELGFAVIVSVASTAISTTTAESESLPMSNPFSISEYSGSVPVIKDEPPDNEMFDVRHNKVPVLKNPSSLLYATGQSVSRNCTIHKGRIVSEVKPANSQKLVMSKVPQIIYPPKVAGSTVFSTSAPLTRYPVSAAHSQTVSRPRFSNESFLARISTKSIRPKAATSISSLNGNIPTFLSTAEPGKDQSKDKGKESLPTGKKLSTINIHSVGVARITDLIARKNPVPTYKPVPIPQHLEGVRKSQIYPCYECGDNFYIEKSLQHHLSRCSMKIYYKCEKCQTTIMFRNKCQLLNHLRSHLNIKKTQAVPIHIKSDSIEIETNFNDLVPDKPFEWYKETKPVEQKCVCLECQKGFADINELKNHVKGDGTRNFYCIQCPIYLHTKCGLMAHQKLHEISELKLNKPLTTDVWKLLKSLSCPECGEHFWTGLGTGTLGNFLGRVTMHLKNDCFHLSRLPAFSCSKCMKVFQSFGGLKNHLSSSLEHYYKCGMCPMALKSLKSLDSHYSQKHKTIDNNDENIGVKAKIIYRCHVCDTLIDDKVFLVTHIDRHLEDFKKHPQTHFHCLQCGQIFMSKNEIEQHSATHNAVKRQYFCTFCSSDKGRPISYISHMLKCHTSTKSHVASKSVVKFCDFCGLVCVGEHMIKKHACLGMRHAYIVVGDNTEREGAKDKNKTNDKRGVKRARTEVEGLRYDIPDNLSGECVSCEAPFYSMSHRISHLKEHRDNDKIFICKSCDSVNFKSYHQLRSHEIACSAMSKIPSESSQSMQYSTESKTFKKTADNTVESYTDGVQLTTKTKARSNQKNNVVEVYTCDKCDAVFTRKSKQEEHIKSEHGFHPCHLCGVIHESQSSLKKHLMIDHEGKRTLFFCGICRNRKNDRAYTNRAKLEKHFRLKHRMKVIDESKIITELPGLPETSKEMSPIAQKRKLSESPSPDSTMKKLKIEGESVFKCAKCLFTSDVKSKFREHISEHKAADSYQCFECGLCFAVLPSLKKHLFMVHKVRDFDSYMEENKIMEPAALEDMDDGIEREPEPGNQEAMEESSDEEQNGNPLECKVCYKTFDNEKALKGHMRIHGMAFIKKSRRRGQASSTGMKSENHDIPCIKANEEGTVKREGLILKIKMNRSEPVSSVSSVSDVSSNNIAEPVETEDSEKSISEPVETASKLSENVKESVEIDVEEKEKGSENIEEDTEKIDIDN